MIQIITVKHIFNCLLNFSLGILGSKVDIDFKKFGTCSKQFKLLSIMPS